MGFYSFDCAGTMHASRKSIMNRVYVFLSKLCGRNLKRHFLLELKFIQL